LTRTVQARCPFKNELEDIDIAADTDTVPVQRLSGWVRNKLSASPLSGNERNRVGQFEFGSHGAHAAVRQSSLLRLNLVCRGSSNEVLPSLIKLDARLPIDDGYTLLGAVSTVQQLSLTIESAARAEATMIHPSLFEMVGKLTELKSMDLQLISGILVIHRVLCWIASCNHRIRFSSLRSAPTTSRVEWQRTRPFNPARRVEDREGCIRDAWLDHQGPTHDH